MDELSVFIRIEFTNLLYDYEMLQVRKLFVLGASRCGLTYGAAHVGILIIDIFLSC